jgi:hypothetical protein
MAAGLTCTYRQVRAEGVPPDVDADLPKVGPTSRPRNEALNETLPQGRAIRRTEHPITLQVSMSLQGSGEPDCERHVTHPSALGARRMSLPDGPLDAQLTFDQINVRPLKRHDLTAP